MNNKIIISSEELRNRAVAVIASLPLDKVHEVIIKPHKKDRSLDQNALYWKWLTVIAADLGETKEDVHERYKGKYLVNIYERDNPEYAEMVQSIRNIWRQGMKKEATALRNSIVSLTSTTAATVPQMSEYMNAVEQDAIKLGIRLPALEV